MVPMTSSFVESNTCSNSGRTRLIAADINTNEIRMDFINGKIHGNRSRNTDLDYSMLIRAHLTFHRGIVICFSLICVQQKKHLNEEK